MNQHPPAGISKLSGSRQLCAAAVVTIKHQDDSDSLKTSASEDDENEDANTNEDDVDYNDVEDAAKVHVENRSTAPGTGTERKAQTKNHKARKRQLRSRQWCKEDIDILCPDFQLTP